MVNTQPSSDRPWPAADILHARTLAIRSIRGVEVNIFSHALNALNEVAEELQVPIALCGGLAAIHYGVSVTTSDIDVVIPASASKSFLDSASRHGFHVNKRSESGWHQLEFRYGSESVNVEVVPEGQRSPRDPDYAPTIPGPAELGVEQGLGYASLAGWLRLKLVANRVKDQYHVVEALKLVSEQQVAELFEQLRELDPRYLTLLNRLLNMAANENQKPW